MPPTSHSKSDSEDYTNTACKAPQEWKGLGGGGGQEEGGRGLVMHLTCPLASGGTLLVHWPKHVQVFSFILEVYLLYAPGREESKSLTVRGCMAS